MNCDPTLTREEFKVLHNTLWELGNINDDRVKVLVERIRREALKGAYEQDNAAFTQQWNYFDEIREANGFRAAWSLYEEVGVGGMDQPHPWPDAQYIRYLDHWGESEVREPIAGSTWLDLYRAADRAIRASGDGHHAFIERFRPDPDLAGCLRLHTGS